MRWQPFDSREPPLGAIYGAVLAACVALAATWIRLGLPRPACPLRSFSGVPCPTCGSTRLVEALLRGETGVAFASNPLVFLLLSAVAVWAVSSTLRRALSWPAPKWVLGPGERLWIRIGALLLIACGWAYTLFVEAF